MYLKILCKTFPNQRKGSVTGLFGFARVTALALKFMLGLLFMTSLQANAIGNRAPAPDPIKGKVIDKATGSPVAGATVSVKGQSSGTSSNEQGEFVINIPSGKSTLVISSVGYATTEQSVSGSSLNIIIQISQVQAGLEEVVVTALGIQRSVKSLTYSTQRISGDQVNQIRDANFANTLSGKIAGLTVTSSANGPGGASRIILRGNRSINGDNNALIVVDGVAIDNSTPSKQTKSDAGDDNGGQSGIDGISSINPDDIESVNVLKGASASALYGSRAANGVILITTKKGKSGKMNVSLNSGVTSENPMTQHDFQNEYSQGAGGTYSTLAGTSWGAKITGQNVTDWAGNSVSLKAYPNNVKDFFRTGVSTNNAIGISGGSEKMQTYLSYANTYANGIVPDNRLMRHTFNARMNLNISDRLTADAKITYVLQNIYDKPNVGGDGAIGANIYRIPRTVDLETLKNYNTFDADGIEHPTYWTSTDPVYMNPFWTINNTHHDENRNRVTGLFSLKYKLTNWLNLQGRVTSDSYNDFITQKYANNTVNRARRAGGFYSEESDFIAERNVDVLLNGINSISSDLKITYNIGGSILTRSSRYRVNIADGLSRPNKYDLSFATPSGSRQVTAFAKRQLQSVYGTTQLSFRDYLFLDVTARNDWSSTLGSPYSYFYPSVGLSAILSDMFKMPASISLAKVRGSYTKVGNDPDPYRLTQTYNFINGGFGGYIASSTTKSIPDLKPEQTTSLEFGTEWRFWNNRFGFDLTYYKTNSKNQLLPVQAPASSGFVAQFLNAGNVQNTGFEAVVTLRPVQRKDFNWDMTLNYALNKNKILYLFPDAPKFYLGSSQNVRTSTPVIVAGGSFGDLYGKKWQRVNGEFLIDANGAPVATAAIENVGNYNPKYTAGFGNNFTYKHWSLGFLIDGKFKGVVTSGSAAQFAYGGTSAITTKFREAGSLVLPGVLTDNSKNTTAISAEKFWQTVAQGDYSWAEFFTYDATNIRVREVSLGYDFPHVPSFLKMARLSLVARNLLFLYRGSSILDIPGIGKRKMDFDPEATFGNSNFQGIEYYNLPTTRSIGLNLKLSF